MKNKYDKVLKKNSLNLKTKSTSIILKKELTEKVFNEVKKESLLIVGIGASAGGLEALEQFLKNVPEKSGLTFVIIQHLDPNYIGTMPEILQRITNMEVSRAKDGLKIKPNSVYLIPPNKYMSILNGKLQLFEPVERHGLRLPIDFFFRSLADDQKENSVGVILSGMGSDGTLGVRAIKEKDGIVLVQTPATAKFDGMPRSVIDSGLSDFIAPANELPALIISHSKHITKIKALPSINDKDQSALEKIIILLRSFTGHDFSHYKKNTIYRRIERRMGIHQIEKISSYVRYLQENQKELEILFKELLIGVTNFFRDPEIWELLKTKVIPSLLASQSNDHIFRAWVPGCSTGEEAYSLAMIFKEVLETTDPGNKSSLQIFATDIDNDAIIKARKGSYPLNISADVSQSLLDKFFIKEDKNYRVRVEIREMVVFAPHNIISNPPFTKLELLFCRNLLIYLDTELQNKLLMLFHYSLKPGGILLLGNSETTGNLTELFMPFQNKFRIYKHTSTSLPVQPVNLSSSYSKAESKDIEYSKNIKPEESLQSMAEQFLLKQYSPSGVLVNTKGDILFINGHTGKYLEPASGKANWNIYVMARNELREKLTGAFQKAISQKESVDIRNIKVGKNGGTQFVDVHIEWIDKPAVLKGLLMIIFKDVPYTNTKLINKKIKVPPVDTRINEIEQELKLSREEHHAALEEMQSSQEELKSSSEELQSTNEELQSTNEELTTSREEMQSLNEELQTVNAELQSKIEALSRINNDMKNLLDSTEIATLFLDGKLLVRQFTPSATKIIKLIPGDIGRPVTDLATDVLYPSLPEDAKEVLRTLVFSEKPVVSRKGQWFKVRIMPYRTIEDKIDGLVITFTEITKEKIAEINLKQTEIMLYSLISSASNAIICLSSEGKIFEFNPEAEKLFGYTKGEVLNRNYFELFIPLPERKKVQKEIYRIIKGSRKANFTNGIKTANGKTYKIEWSAINIYKDTEQLIGIIIKKKDDIKI